MNSNPARADELETWLGRVLASYSVLAVDADAFREWAKLMHRQSDTLIQDAMIAAVAIVHRLTVVTRNVKDFEQLGVQVLTRLQVRTRMADDVGIEACGLACLRMGANEAEMKVKMSHKVPTDNQHS